jgi:hypothetical protein
MDGARARAAGGLPHLTKALADAMEGVKHCIIFVDRFSTLKEKAFF